MYKKILPYLIFTLGFCVCKGIDAQEPVNIGSRIQQRIGGIRSAIGGTGGADSLEKRSQFEDSVVISYRLLDSSGVYFPDSSVADITDRFPLPVTFIHLGNPGLAARSLLFSPIMKSGFDNGFHALDIYKWIPEKIRFYNTSRPFTELHYLLGSRAEQIIEVFHTQNIRPEWNFSFRYRLINSPGFFQNQRTHHNNYLFTSLYQSPNLRYRNYTAILANKLIAAENGGIVDTNNILDNPDYKERFNINTYLGGNNPFTSNFFGNKINTGNRYSEFIGIVRQQYDLGRKDSIVSDTTIIPLFFPRFRFEHTFKAENDRYVFHDYVADSFYYKKRYDTALNGFKDTLVLTERWRTLSNDFSIYQFPDARNLQQFIKLGITFEYITGILRSGQMRFINTFGHAEYRNKTRNRIWDMVVSGKLFLTGFNAGDFDVFVSLKRLLSNKTGYLTLQFENVSRTPSFVFDRRSSFFLMRNAVSLNKENNTRLTAVYSIPAKRLQIQAHYYLITNYTYFTKYYKVQQHTPLFNVLQTAVFKTFRYKKHWNWHAELYVQQKIGNVPLNLPLVYTRHRFAYEGNFGFKNLDIALGFDVRYRPPYKADDYSPVLGQFFYQDSVVIRNDLPDISAYVHFRIKPFKAFIRAENLNTARIGADGTFGFTNNNVLAPGYALPGLQIRIGIFWNFIN